jgi:hypothetical protein
MVRFAINGLGQVVRDGSADTTTSIVKELYYHAHTLYQRNTDNDWFSWNTAIPSWQPATSPKQLWNRLNKNSGLVLSSDELTVTASLIITDQTVFGTRFVIPGQVNGVYWEANMSMVDSGYPNIGIGTQNSLVVDFAWVGQDENSIGWHPSGDIFYNFNNVGFVPTGVVWPAYATGDLLSMAINTSNWTFYGRVNNGLWNANPTANPQTGVGGFQIPVIMQTQGILPGTSLWTNTDVSTAFFERSSWRFFAPTGFVPWSEIVSTGPAPPTQAFNANYRTLVFEDDFKSDTLATSKTQGLTPGKKWYWVNQVDAYFASAGSWSLNTAGNGILTINCQRGGFAPVFWGNSVFASSPVNVLTTTWPAGTAWGPSYIEISAQTNVLASPTGLFENGWPALWSWGIEGTQSGGFGGSGLTAPVTEIDFMELQGGLFGNPAGANFFNVENPAGNVTPVAWPGTYPTLTNTFHTYGLLWVPGTISVYYDNVLQGTHSTAGWNLEGTHMFIILGTGIGWPIYIDWVRVWQ